MKKFACIKKNAYLCTRNSEKEAILYLLHHFRDVAQSG